MMSVHVRYQRPTNLSNDEVVVCQYEIIILENELEILVIYKNYNSEITMNYYIDQRIILLLPNLC